MRIPTGWLRAAFPVSIPGRIAGFALEAAEYTLLATPSTVVWGYYSAHP